MEAEGLEMTEEDVETSKTDFGIYKETKQKHRKLSQLKITLRFEAFLQV